MFSNSIRLHTVLVITTYCWMGTVSVVCNRLRMSNQFKTIHSNRFVLPVVIGIDTWNHLYTIWSNKQSLILDLLLKLKKKCISRTITAYFISVLLFLNWILTLMNLQMSKLKFGVDFFLCWYITMKI